MNKIKLFTGIAISIVLMECQNKNTARERREATKERYEETWESLEKINEAPEWFKDAKLGIYTHWGPVSEALKGMENGGGWYGFLMYQDSGAINWRTGKLQSNQPTSVFKQHVEKYGHPSEFGYKDVIPTFQPDNFDADAWAELFKKAGAKFAAPVAMHHDNFAMWDSDVTRWNVKRTTGIDVTGELKKAIENRDMKFITSFHHAFTWVYYALAHDFDATEATSDFYTEPHKITNKSPTKRFHEEWFAKLKEVVDNYQPDVVWFDWWVEELDEEYRKKFLAYYFKKANEWGKEVVINYKNTSFPA